MHSRIAFRVLLLLLALNITVATRQQCTSKEECCSLCGDHSMRCVRGPCGTSFFTKTVFSISVPTGNLTFADIMNSFYGTVPYFVPLVLVIELIRRRTWTRVFAFLFIPIVAMINMILVKGLGHCSKCARPCGSCVASNGMPSGHASNAIGFCLWVVLETLIGVGRQWSIRRKAILVVVDLALFLPVPYSRVYLGDHTPLQVVIGSSTGTLFALIYFIVLRFVVGKRLQPPTPSRSLVNSKTRMCCFIENDYYVPKSMEFDLMEDVVALNSPSNNSV